MVELAKWVRRTAHAARHPWYAVRRFQLFLYEVRHPSEPWIAAGAVRFCETALTPAMVGLEWGSGRSTLWFASRLKHLTSVEHNPTWYERIRAELRARHNVDYRFVPLDHPPQEPTKPIYDETPRYVAVAQEFSDESLDFVVVDGHYRQACVLAVLPKLKHGGLLLIDNWNFLPAAAWGVPSDYRLLHKSSNAMTQTAIWQKP